MNLELRERTETDVARIVGWVPDEQALYLFTGPRLSWPLTTAHLAEMTDLPGLSAWSVDDDSDLIGHFDLTIENGTARLGRVIIDPTRRGQGLAQPLINAAITKARDLGASELELTVIADNLPAIRTYERAGFATLVAAPRPGVQAMTRSL